jgi:hypothetical protein
MKTPFEVYVRERIRLAEEEGRSARNPRLAALRARDAEGLRRLLRLWESTITPAGREAAKLGIPTGPFHGGFL